MLVAITFGQTQKFLAVLHVIAITERECTTPYIYRNSNIILNLMFCRKRKDRHDGGAPSGFSRFPAGEEESDEEDDYEKERRKRS